MTNIFKREITIHDKDGKRFDLTISNKWSSTWPYFSICSQSWQWQFNPKSDIQQQLLDIWDTYHLNWMSAGTQEQMEIVNSLEDKSYDNACKVLKEKWLYEVEYKWKTYKYWHWWIYKDFPDNFEEDLFNLIDELIEEEDEYNERKITIEDLDNEEFLEHANDNCEWEYEKLMAACLHCWVSWSWLENVTCNWDWDYWDIEWWDYCIYTDEEADEACKEDIKETAWAFNPDFIISHSKVLNYDKWSYDILKAIQEQCESWNDAILKLIDDIDEFCDDAISSDWRWHFLSWYNWHENEVDINWTTYYLYRNN